MRSRLNKAAVIGCLLSLPLVAVAPSAQAAVKGQYIAKMYTEGLGRIPDQNGWLSALNTFASQGCNSTTLRNFGKGVYTSAEFTSRSYDNASRLLALYRGALNREPYATEYNNNLTLLNTGTSWTTMVNNLFNSSEFSNMVSTMCNSANYGFGSGLNYPIQPPISGTGFSGSQANLQNLINSTPAGGTVFLAQKAVIWLHQPLILKAGVTVATTGLPNVNHYAKQARLVRNFHFNAPMIQMSSGSQLRSVWVDGQRNNLGYSFEDVNVQLYAGTGTTVDDCRIGNTSGGTNLKNLGLGDLGTPCSGHVLRDNLVDGYTSSHFNNLWADGFTVACEDTLVENNEFVDASDVSVVVFGSPSAVQRSIVRNNRILNVGNSSYGGLNYNSWKDDTQLVDFSASIMENNLLWSGPSVHFDVVLGVGNAPWDGASARPAFGATMRNNTSGISKINADMGISVDKMLSATVTGNTLDLTLMNFSSCPTAAVVAAISANRASGTIQGPILDQAIPICMKH